MKTLINKVRLLFSNAHCFTEDEMKGAYSYGIAIGTYSMMEETEFYGNVKRIDDVGKDYIENMKNKCKRGNIYGNKWFI